MKKERVLLERIVLERSDLNKLALQRYANLGSDYIILSGRNRRYICHINKDRDYQVLGVYEVKSELDPHQKEMFI